MRSISYLRIIVVSVLIKLIIASDIHYNIPDPECTGPFGLCTQEDKIRLGFLAIKKLHAKMDDDSDGQVEIKEILFYKALARTK